MSWDPYLDLRAGVLHNRLGITDRAALAAAEADLSAVRIAQLTRRPLPGRYDLDHLRAFHRHVFGDVYAWAGEIRTVSLGKGHLFCPPDRIEASAEEIFGGLARTDRLRGLRRDDFVAALADLLGAINSLHPFREGNGRTQRAFVTQLAADAGHRVRWAAMDRARNVAASRAAHRGDTGPLRTMLDGLVAPLGR